MSIKIKKEGKKAEITYSINKYKIKINKQSWNKLIGPTAPSTPKIFEKCGFLNVWRAGFKFLWFKTLDNVFIPTFVKPKLL